MLFHRCRCLWQHGMHEYGNRISGIWAYVPKYISLSTDKETYAWIHRFRPISRRRSHYNLLGLRFYRQKVPSTFKMNSSSSDVTDSSLTTPDNAFGVGKWTQFSPFATELGIILSREYFYWCCFKLCSSSHYKAYGNCTKRCSCCL